ncbi:MAG: HEAT repeat domain-containing protein [Candidatus Wallbacteria bacterium]|nr:HEAT repeat domain-containing protein [Candidatus Wallbacteria bacterium]
MDREKVIKGLSEGDSQQRYQMLFEAADSPRQEYYAILISLLEDKDEWIRLNAVRALAALGSGTAVTPLLDLLKREENNYVKAALLKTLGKLGNKKLLPVIVPFFNDSDSRVVANSIEAIELIGDRSVADKVRHLLGHQEIRVRVNAAKALWKFGFIEALDELLRMIEAKESWVRDSVIYALGEINTPQTRKVLCQHLGSEEEESIRIKIIEILGKIGDEQSIPFLRECLKGKSLRLAESAQLAISGITLRRGEHQHCPDCGAMIRKGNKFCGQCGCKMS